MKTRNWSQTGNEIQSNNVKDFFSSRDRRWRWSTMRIRIGVKSRSNVGMFKHTKSKKASNSQLGFQTHPATDGRHLFFCTGDEAATAGGTRLKLIPSFG